MKCGHRRRISFSLTLAAWCGVVDSFRLFSPHYFQLRHLQRGSCPAFRNPKRHSSLRASADETDLNGSFQARGEGSMDISKNVFFLKEMVKELKESVSIVSVIESFNLPSFRRRGNSGATALCPFHEDRNPSLSIDDSRKIYKCFSCGAGGDVFKFIREFAALQGETIDFHQSVRIVSEEYADPSLNSRLSLPIPSGNDDKERRAILEKKIRLDLVNAAAAAYFASSLFSLSSGGEARQYLRSRGISAETVCLFALGYAPDSYFRPNRIWGDGSLVEHLRLMNFTASEIFDAGLAVVVKGGSQSERNLEYSNIMDRFRGRLMIPIFDAKGVRVLAFAGRALGVPQAKTNDAFKAPKYLNSPESLIFQKKKVLFGLHIATQSIGNIPRNNDKHIILVEGYMDAISLWEAGVKNVVATMGTAITDDYLAAAAQSVGPVNGRLYLCLDRDEAGHGATERLCTNGYLAKASDQFSVGIMIATLPEHCKDPADYFEKGGTAEDFKSSIIDTATEWTEWQLAAIVSTFDSTALRGTRGSFTDICDRAAEFVSTLPNLVERTKRVHEMAKTLSSLIAAETNSDVPALLPIQLESDFQEMVRRKAAATQSLVRRVEGTNKALSQKNQAVKFEKLGRGEGLEGVDENMLSWKALKSRQGNQISRDLNLKRFSWKGKGSKSNSDAVIPHFNGFDFENQSDYDWLHPPRGEKWKRKGDDLTLGFDSRLEYGQKKPYSMDENVYFNSNEYLGIQYGTHDAMQSSWSPALSGESQAKHSFREETASTLNILIEESLLRSLAESDRARAAVRAALGTFRETDSCPNIEWSNPSRGWLFEALVGTNIPKNIVETGTLQTLRDYLSQLESAPAGSFSSKKTEHGKAPSFPSPSPDAANVFCLSKSAIESSGGDSWTFVEPQHQDDIGKWEASFDPCLLNDCDVLDTTGKSRQAIQVSDQEGAIDAEFVSSEISGDRSRVIDQSASESQRSESVGCLEAFFVPSNDPLFSNTPDASRDSRAELGAQESLMSLLVASALKERHRVHCEWLICSQILEQRSGDGASDSGSGTNDCSKVVSPFGTELKFQSMALQDLEKYANTKYQEIKDFFDMANKFELLRRKLKERILNSCVGVSSEGKLTEGQQLQMIDLVNSFMEEEINHRSQDDFAGEPLSAEYNFHSRQDDTAVPQTEFTDEDTFEEDLNHINTEWSEWIDDQYLWTSEDCDSTGGPINIEIDDDDDFDPHENLEEDLARIDNEWGDFLTSSEDFDEKKPH